MRNILTVEAEKDHAALVKRERFIEKIRSRFTRRYTWADFVHQTRALKPEIKPQEGEISRQLYGDINR